jgi:CBS domain-containing protein
MSIMEILREKGHQVVTARPTDSVMSVVRELAGQGIGAVVVASAWMRPVGIFSERDLVGAVAEHGAAALNMPIGNFMKSPVVSCRPMDRIDDAMARMTAGKIRHLPVIENGKLLGIVSIGDLVKHRLDEKVLEANVLLDLTRMHA